MGSYLSAADIALFLRHNHTMNQVVTSGKLGEYLAAGLPVVTTGANTDMLNNFIRLRRAGAFIPDSLQLSDENKQEISNLLQLSKSVHWRIDLSECSDRYFNLELNFFRGYLENVLALLAK
jgi:glycosyltransferase involved in cell wall biosynthesis